MTTPSTSSLPGGWTPAEASASFEQIEAEIRRSFEDMRTHRVAPTRSIAETEERVGAIDFDGPIGVSAAFQEAAELMREGDLLSASSRCFGYFNPTAAWPGVLGDVLAAARNPQTCVVTHAPASVSMERRVISWFVEQLGWPATATGNFTSGGSEANATAVLVALVRAHPEFSQHGVRAFERRPLLYASANSHLAWIKIARASGMGVDAVRLVPTTSDGKLDAEALAKMLREDREHGGHPVMIAATAGTTSAGEVDPLHACRQLADEFGAHLHVDAAWAGALLVDDSRKHLLDGIELADSITVDAHKWLSVPMGAGMIFMRDPQAVAQAFAVQTGYMPSGDGVDPYIMTNQWSRRFLGIRLWMMLRACGPQGYRAMFDQQFAAAEWLRAELLERGWTIRNHSAFPLILFEDAGGVPSRALADALEADGQVWMGCVDYEGRTLLRACFTSFLTDRADLELMLSRLDALRETMTPE